MLHGISMKRFFLCLFVSLLLCFSANAAPRQINDVYVVHLVLDGMNRKIFQQILESGKIPNVEEYFVKHGAVFTHALSHFPTSSTDVYQSYVTGLLPGNSGIPHLERFDRKNQKIIGYLSTNGYLQINKDLINLRALENPAVAQLDPPTTIFEILNGHPTFALYSSFRRGASDYFPTKVPSHALWSAYIEDEGEKIDVLAYKKIFNLFKKPPDEIPRYMLVGLYSVDFLSHEYGIESEEVKNAVIQFDYFLREFLALLKQRGLLDKTYIIVSGDHGMHDTGERFDLRKPLQEAGVFIKPNNLRIKDYTLYAADRGISSTHIYVKHDGGWDPVEDAQILRNHPKKDGGQIDLIETILALDPTMLLIARDGKRAARIFDSNGGESRIECFTLNQEEWCSYKIEPRHTDPLNYSLNPRLKSFLDGQPHSTIDWEEATADEYYPDAVIELSQIFRDGRAGDFFVIPKVEWGFRKAKAATHGSIIADDMRVPFLIAGPTVPTGVFDILRSCDVYPLLLKWFGIDVPKENYDGVDPFEKIVPTSKEWQQLAVAEQSLADGGSSHGRKISISKKLMPLAREELAQRRTLLEKLENYEAELEKQSTDNSDHIDIVRRIIALTKERAQRMEKIVALFNKSAGTSSARFPLQSE